MGLDVKECRYCGETIKAVAIKCRFCGEFLARDPRAEAQEPAAAPQPVVLEGAGLASQLPDAPCSAASLSELDIADLLDLLVQKSLVSYDESGRYAMTESIRGYAEQRLSESGATEAARTVHLAHFVQWAEAADDHLTGPDQAVWFGRIETEHDNLRAALGTSFARAGTAEASMRLVGAAQYFWAVRGYLREGQEWCRRALERDDGEIPERTRAAALHGAGNLAYCLGEFAEARRCYEQVLEVRRALGDRRGAAGALGSLGNVAQFQGDYESARQLFEESLAINRELGNRLWEAANLSCLSTLTYMAGDTVAGRAYVNQALALNRELGHRSTEAINLQTLSIISRAEGDLETALSCAEQACRITSELGDRFNQGISTLELGSIALAAGDMPAAARHLKTALDLVQPLDERRALAGILAGCGDLQARKGDSAEAARLWGAAAAMRETIGAPLSTPTTAAQAAAVARAREALPDGAFDAGWTEGAKMSRAQAIARALGGL